MEDWGQRAGAPPPRAFDISDDGTDLTICFSGVWRRVVILLAWLLLVALVVGAPFVVAWLLQWVVSLWNPCASEETL